MEATMIRRCIRTRKGGEVEGGERCPTRTSVGEEEEGETGNMDGTNEKRGGEACLEGSKERRTHAYSPIR